MAISVKAVFNFSATAATTGAWSITASTSIAVGDVLVLAASYRSSSSGTTSAVADNAGNVWTAVRHFAPNNANAYTGMWYAPVTTTTANFQISFIKSFAKTVSARAMHLLVLSGVDATPLDSGSVNHFQASANSGTSFTLLTSATTSVGTTLLVGVAGVHAGSPASVSYNADAAWTMQGAAVEALGGAGAQQQIWTRAIASQDVHNFSLSASNGGLTPHRGHIIAGFRESAAAVNSISGATDITFGAAATGTATAATLSAATTVVFSPVATGTATAATLSGAATVEFGVAVTGQALNAITGDVALTFGVAGSIAGTAATLSGAAAVAFGVAANVTGTAATLSGAADVTFAPVATAVATAATLSGAATVEFGVTGSIANAGSGSISGAADVAFGVAATGTADAATLSGASNVVFGVFASIEDVGTGVVEAPANYGSWDPRTFRRLLEARRRELLEQSREILAEVRETTATASASAPAIPAYVKSAVQREASAVAQRLLAFNVASARREFRLREQEQQLAAIRVQLQALAARIEDDEDDEDFLLMVA